MKINGVDFDVDFTDADIIEKIDKGCKIVDEESEKLRKKENEIEPAEGIRQECKIIKDFLDYVFGEGTSKKLFGDKDSLILCINTFEDIIKARDEQVKSIETRLNKYSPERLKR